MIQKKNLIVFDIDGTLSDSVAIHQRAFRKALTAIGVQEIAGQFNDFLHHTDAYIARVIYEKDTRKVFDPATMSAFETVLLAQTKLQGRIPPIADAQKTLKSIEQHSNYAIAFATGSLQKPAEYKLKSIGIPFAAKQLVTANHFEDRESIVKMAIENAKAHYQVAQFEQIIAIGDGIWDLKTANNLSLSFIGIGPKNKAALLANGAKIHLEDWRTFELEQITEQLQSSNIVPNAN